MVCFGRTSSSISFLEVKNQRNHSSLCENCFRIFGVTSVGDRVQIFRDGWKSWNQVLSSVACPSKQSAIYSCRFRNNVYTARKRATFWVRLSTLDSQRRGYFCISNSLWRIFLIVATIMSKGCRQRCVTSLQDEPSFWSSRMIFGIGTRRRARHWLWQLLCREFYSIVNLSSRDMWWRFFVPPSPSVFDHVLYGSQEVR